jgi:hypothetical protein
MGKITVKHAVLTDDHFYYIDKEVRKLKRDILQFPVKHISDLYDIGMFDGITHFWIMPGTEYDNLAYATLEDREGFNIFYTRDKDGTLFPEPRAARARKDGVYGTVYVCYPHRPRFAWNVSRPLDILAAIDYLERELKITVQWSPGHISHQLLRVRNSTPVRKKWLQESTVDLFKLPFKESARPLKLRKPLSLDMAGKWLHNYDKNSAYLACAQGLNAGCGDPVHMPYELCGDINIKLPGIYRVKMITWDFGDLPPIIDREWVTSDILQYAISEGHRVEIVEAWQFPEHHQLFRDWGSALWDTRARLNPENRDCDAEFPYAPGRANAYKTVKKIATLGPGRFAMEEVAHDFMRPDWWWSFVGRGRVNGLRNLKNFCSHPEVSVQFVDNDAMTFLTSESDHRKAVPGILDREGKLGGYKHVWSLLLTPDIIRQSQQLTDGKMVTFLSHLALGLEDK